ncbi:MAG: flagellar export chaperone FliS [Candidatus Eremiobacteraeota bacterium]|nr:flagellar export chaperone FliS [Candidatus Eremiobacteraeota bacterium]
MTPQELKYLETSLNTAPKEELILRVYDALIMLSRQAVEKLNNDPGNIEGIHNLLLRSQRACIELIGGLNFEIGGELAQNLNLVYAYWHRELVRANMEQDATRIDKILPDIIDYRKTWAEAIKEWRKQQITEERSGDEFASTA